MTGRSLLAQLIAIRTRSGILQATVAKRMGVGRNAISRLENDAGRDPKLSTILRYATAINATITITHTNTKNAAQEVKSHPCTED